MIPSRIVEEKPHIAIASPKHFLIIFATCWMNKNDLNFKQFILWISVVHTRHKLPAGIAWSMNDNHRGIGRGQVGEHCAPIFTTDRKFGQKSKSDSGKLQSYYRLLLYEIWASVWFRLWHMRNSTEKNRIIIMYGFVLFKEFERDLNRKNSKFE